MRRKSAIAAALLTIFVGGGAFAFVHGRAAKTASAPPPPPPVPIVAGAVDQHDVPIYLTGVGTVIAYNTDVIRAQVTGEIISINFTEGQTVHKGDLLAQIDPRPYQALVDQYVANRDRDQAHLVNARKDLVRFSNLAKKGAEPQELADSQQAGTVRPSWRVSSSSRALTSSPGQSRWSLLGKFALSWIEPVVWMISLLTRPSVPSASLIVLSWV